jgi:GMP synthase-like glutamine amidotransferase
MFRIAILDLYEGTPNMGMNSLRQMIGDFAEAHGLEIRCEVFEVRQHAELPDLSYDAYVSSGGPGSPLDSEGSLWESRYFALMDGLLAHNAAQPDKKPVFLICHSFQLFCRYYRIGTVGLRRNPSFGIYPVHKTQAGERDPFFVGLDEPFWIADFRKFQVTRPDFHRLREMGGEILALEKERPHVPLERALMAIRFTPEIFGTQFHPEADPEGMLYWFQQEEKRRQIVDEHGMEKYYDMLEHLGDPDKLAATMQTVIPQFLALATGVAADKV